MSSAAHKHRVGMPDLRSAVKSLEPIRSEIVSPEEFLRISKQSAHLIARSRFVPPQIGQRSFGAFEIQYTIPMFRERAA